MSKKQKKEWTKVRNNIDNLCFFVIIFLEFWQKYRFFFQEEISDFRSEILLYMNKFFFVNYIFKIKKNTLELIEKS